MLSHFGPLVIGGWAGCTGHIGGSKHYSGLAIDAMTNGNKALGYRIANYFIANHGRVDIENVIFDGAITNAGLGWKLVPGSYGHATANYEDHPHIDFHADATVGGAASATIPAADLADPAAAQCVPTGDTVLASSTVVYPVDKATDRHKYGGSGPQCSRGYTGTDFSLSCGTRVKATTGVTVEIDTSQGWAGTWLVKVVTGPKKLTTLVRRHAEGHHRGRRRGDRRATDRRGRCLGNSTGCHLHFEVHPRNGSINQDGVDPS